MVRKGFLENRACLKRVAISIALVVLVWVIFGQTLGHQFLNFDDPPYVLKNPHIFGGMTWSSVGWLFTHVHAQNWHPITSLSHMVDCQIFGLNPRWHHAGNVWLHGIAAALLFLALWRMTGALWPSAFVAAVFAIHPLRVESVAWVAERKDVLSGVFFMITLLTYTFYASAASIGRYLLVTAVFACGLMSKPMLVTTPLVLLLLDYWPLGRVVGGSGPRSQITSRRLMIEKIPLLALSLVSSWATLWAQRSGLVTEAMLPWRYRLANAAVSYVSYIGQMFWPHNLTPFYLHPEDGLQTWRWMSAVFLLIGITTVAFVRRQQNPYFFVGWLWYLIMLVPVIGVIQVGLQSHADRYTYLPQIGLYLGLTWLVCDLTKEWKSRAIVLAPVAIIMLAVFSVLSWKQLGYWRDSDSLWKYTLSVTPQNAFAETSLAGSLLKEGKIEEAIIHYRLALSMRTNNAGAEFGLAAALESQQKVDEAIEHYEKALGLQPDSAVAGDQLAQLLTHRGDYGEAIKWWENSLRFEPNDENALGNLAWIYATCSDANLRNRTRAVELAEHANRLANESNVMVLRALAVAYAQDSQFERAIATAEHAISVAKSNGQDSLADDLRRYLDAFKRGQSLPEGD